MGKVTIENLDGTERELDTVESFKERPDGVHQESGLYGVLQDFLPKEGDNGDTHLSDDEVKLEKSISDILAKAEADRTDEDKTLLGSNQEIVTKLTAPPPPPPKLEEMDAKSLVEEVKKNQRIISERDEKLKTFDTVQTENNQLKVQLKELKEKKVGEDPTAQAFFEALRKDATAAWSQFKVKLNLPDLTLVQSQFVGGGHTARLKQYLETTVKPQIESEFGMEKGTFKFSAEEAEADPTSASAHYLELKRGKETELRNEVATQESREKGIAEAVKAQQAADLKWYTDKYLGGDEAKAKALWAEVEAKAIEVASGKAKPEEHPFSLRTILQGYNHTRLVQEAVEKNTTELKQQFAALSMFLPGETKENITNLTKIPAPKPKDDGKPFKIEKSEFSPMLGSMEDLINTNTKK